MMWTHEHVTAFMKSCYSGGLDAGFVGRLVVALWPPQRREKRSG